MADHLGSNFDQLFTQRSQRPLLHRLGQCQTPQEIAKVVSQSKELKADLIIHKIMARKPVPALPSIWLRLGGDYIEAPSPKAIPHLSRPPILSR